MLGKFSTGLMKMVPAFTLFILKIVCFLQKNPGTIRNPEEDKGQERLIMTLGVNLDLAKSISPYVFNMCSKAETLIFSRESDLKAWSAGK